MCKDMLTPMAPLSCKLKKVSTLSSSTACSRSGRGSLAQTALPLLLRTGRRSGKGRRCRLGRVAKVLA